MKLVLQVKYVGKRGRNGRRKEGREGGRKEGRRKE